MKLKIALFCAFLFLQGYLSQILAQNRTVSGVVTGGTAATPLAGASVTVKGTTAGTTTDERGNFSLSVPSSARTLVISYTGMANREVDIPASGVVSVGLADLAGTMNEVIVVGYGTQKKSVVTGAISSVKAGDLENQPINRVEQFLQGRASGLTIAQASGQPGSGSTLRVRGTTTLGNSDPLYVVDGVPVDIGGIDYLNPNDIESIEVLKDAASAAIYGARAAAGVLLITTKKGRSGTMRVNYNGYYGTQRPARKLHLLNAEQYATLRNEALVNDGKAPAFANPHALGAGTDWQDLIFSDNAKIQDHQVSISGGTDRSTFYTSFALFDQDGIVAPEISNYKRFTIRLNSTHKISKWITFGNNLGYSHIKAMGIGNTNSEYGGLLSSAVNLDPLTQVVITDPVAANSAPYAPSAFNGNGVYTIRDANGNPYGISELVRQEMSNPLAYIQTHRGNHGWSDNFVGNAFVELEPVKGLKLRTNIGAKYAFWGSESFSGPYVFNAVNFSDDTTFYRESNRALNFTFENTASYGRRFGLHNVSLLVGTGAYVDNYLSRNGGVT
ncbi:MAG: hypothetical protein JWP27_2130, partial [Flaviaesturariibacter sp.]|nr:hypothetical protein [Flaviaesturariibacter sp.]